MSRLKILTEDDVGRVFSTIKGKKLRLLGLNLVRTMACVFDGEIDGKKVQVSPYGHIFTKEEDAVFDKIEFDYLRAVK